MEWYDLISPIVSALLAAFAAYTATKRAAEDRERKRDEEIAELRVEIKHLIQEVEKHNKVIERTYKLESEVDNLYHLYDEVRSDIKDIKIGGTE